VYRGRVGQYPYARLRARSLGGRTAAQVPPMPVRPCPQCRNPTARLLESASEHAHVWYYRCEKCGHVWNVPKNDPDATPRPVTPPRKNPKD